MNRDYDKRSNVSYTYRPSYLLAFGIEFIILCVPTLIFLMIGIHHSFMSNLGTKDQIFLVVLVIGIPLITFYGGYNIVQGIHQFELKFSETNFKSYKDLKLQINVSIKKIERVNITQGEVFFLIYGGFKYFELSIEIEDMENYELTIRGKKWISRFLEFTKLLKFYCREHQIHLTESK